MNERVQELAEQCYQIEDPHGRFPREVFNQEKFAEWIISELTHNWTDAKRSEWRKVKVKPESDGWYEVCTKTWKNPHFLEFKDGEWDIWDYKQVTKWRGLAEKPVL